MTVEATEIARNGMNLILEGKVRNHKLKDSASIHTVTMERREANTFINFLSAKTSSFVYEIKGCPTPPCLNLKKSFDFLKIL